jgi:chemotaxis protein methyltransferase CheR
LSPATARSRESLLGLGAPPSAQLLHIRDLVYRVAGIFQPDSKLGLLESRCRKRMQMLGVATLQDYYRRLTVKPTLQAELVALLNEITVGETFFFRNQPQLDALRNIVVPRIVQARAKMSPRHLRIWSAGCSTGEEPYTLCMMLLEELSGPLKGWTFEILATDLNELSVAHAEQGLYSDYSTRTLPEHFRQKYFIACGENLQINAELKNYVKFSRLNFLDDPGMAAINDLDVIFCCNVLIYFHGAAKSRVIEHFYDNLLPHGYLFLGHSESLYGVNEDFRLVHLPSATAYVQSEKRQLATPVRA